MDAYLFPNLISPARSQFRACELCVAGDRSLAGGFVCKLSGEPVALARSEGGSCGTDARHLRTDFALS